MTPGIKLAQIVQAATDEHFNGEIESYCFRHGMTPTELNVDFTLQPNNAIIVTLGPRDQRLVTPRRKWRFRISMESCN